MGKSGIGVVLIASTELALATENRFRIHPTISSNIANRIHDVIGFIITAIVHCNLGFILDDLWFVPLVVGLQPVDMGCQLSSRCQL